MAADPMRGAKQDSRAEKLMSQARVDGRHIITDPDAEENGGSGRPKGSGLVRSFMDAIDKSAAKYAGLWYIIFVAVMLAIAGVEGSLTVGRAVTLVVVGGVVGGGLMFVWQRHRLRKAAKRS